MTDQNTAAGEGEPITVVTADAGAPEEYTMNHAAKALADIRFKRNQPAESAEAATAETELSGEDNAGPETAPSENEGTDPEEKLPPVERPRSWSKDDDDEWNAIPRERQEKIAAKELAREADINQRINKAAETTKAAEAKVAQAEQARQQFESKLSTAVKAMESTLQAEFGDIQTMQDVRNLQANDPFRFQAWQVRQMELTAAKSEQIAAEQRQAQEKQTEWNNHVQTENEKAAELIPELKTPEKNAAFYKRAVDTLDELGFSKDEVQKLVTGNEKLSIHDHRLQQLLSSHFRLADIQKAPKAIAEKPVPPVQRPGTSKPPGSANSERVQALDNTLTTTGSLKAAQELRVAQLRSQRRAS